MKLNIGKQILDKALARIEGPEEGRHVLKIAEVRERVANNGSKRIGVRFQELVSGYGQIWTWCSPKSEVGAQILTEIAIAAHQADIERYVDGENFKLGQALRNAVGKLVSAYVAKQVLEQGQLKEVYTARWFLPVSKGEGGE